MKTSTHRSANKIMLAMSLVLFISSGLILGVRALTIGTASINTMQVIKRIIISNTNSTASDDVLIDFNNDAAGTVYIKNKLGIGDSTPSAALEVSGNIIANQYCDSDGTTCSTVSNMIGGGTGFVETDPIYSGGVEGKLCILANGKIVCNEEPAAAGVDTTLTEAQVDAFVANNGYLTSYTENDPTIPTATSCTSGQVIKYNGTTRICGTDNVSDGAGGGDESTTNELQDLSLDGNTLSLSGSTTTIDLSIYLDNTAGLWSTGISSINYMGGNVGIGTSNPQKKLDINGDLQIAKSEQTGTPNIYIRKYDIGGGTNIGNISFIGEGDRGEDIQGNIGYHNENGFNFSTKFGSDIISEKVTIAPIGNVGIGTTTPETKLEIKNTLNTEPTIGQISIKGYNATYIGDAYISFQEDTENTIRSAGKRDLGDGFAISNSGSLNENIKFLINTNGNIGIGTDNPTEALHVSGNVLADAFLYPSDRRLKTNIVKLAPALDNIRKINPYTFDRKSNGKSSIGFIAQEMEDIYPILVHTNDEGIKSINYVNMVVPLTQAVKELDAENQKLKAEIAEIKATLLK